MWLVFNHLVFFYAYKFIAHTYIYNNPKKNMSSPMHIKREKKKLQPPKKN